MALECLLLCRDPDAQRVFRRALDELGIGIEVSTVAEAALERLETHKFDAVIVDCDGMPCAAAVLNGLQKTPSNKRAIALALINGRTTLHDAFAMGAHFVVEKPLVLDRVLRSLRVAQGLMLTEQRRYFRCPVEAKVFLTFGCVKQLPCTATNVSEGGMAVQLKEQVSPSWVVEVRFDLPGVTAQLEAKGEFAWSDAGGNAGIRFTQVPADSKKLLARWVAEQILKIEGSPEIRAGMTGAGRRLSVS